MIHDETEPTEYDTIAPVTMPLAGGSIVSGLWCETCLLPSRHEAQIYLLGEDGPRPIGVIDRCFGCQP